MFEIKHRDAMGRIGTLKVRGRKIETPVLLPVVNPRHQLVSPTELGEMGFEGVITNAYIIYQDQKLRSRALRGLHGMLGFDGVIMTDSGSFQLYSYGKIDVDPGEIVEFQDAIGTDIGVILDIPSAIDASREEAEAQLRETLRRARDSAAMDRRMLLAGTVQGGVYTDLRKKAARKMAELDFDVYPIGGVVPLMESYMFPELVSVVMACKEELPPDKPVHLFGCGHPMFFALAAACGCDIFDSAAYAIYARDGRYITPTRTTRLKEMQEFPCSCRVCSTYTPRELAASEDWEKLLSRHNLHVSLEEIKRVKESIRSGSLLELLEQRCRGHPYLLDALKVFYDHEILLKYDPVTKKSAFFYSGPESLRRPEVRRHLERLFSIPSRGRTLVLLPEVEKPSYRHYGIQGARDYHLCVVSPVFGVVPLEIEDIYPLSQHEAPRRIDVSQEKHMAETAKKYAERFREVLIHPSLSFLGMEGEYLDDLESLGLREDLRQKAVDMADYLFGPGAGEALFHDARIEKAGTGRVRRAVSNQGLIATFRASDGFIIPTILGAQRLLGLPFPRNRVVVTQDAAEFVEQGKSVFSKFVATCDEEIRPYQEVIVVSKEDRLLATGKAVLNAEEMMCFSTGVAVKTRHHI
jgi:7-cyano-7-deazaguanine tRNA-ribosyltransferase